MISLLLILDCINTSDAGHFEIFSFLEREAAVAPLTFTVVLFTNTPLQK